MQPAPLFDDVARGPAGGRALWVKAADDVRLRVVLWPHEAGRGTVLMMHGRGEYAEKYGLAAAELAARGYAAATVDWRGQGLSDRLLGDPARGHVGRFGDYQHDVRALIAAARAEGLPQPFHLLAHSMGGCIALRALHDGAPVRSVAFSAPMWGLLLPAATGPFAGLLTGIARLLGQGHRYAPGTGPIGYLRSAPAEGNVLTSDHEMFRFLQDQISRHPDLALGGPTLHWVNEALRETRALMALPAPSLPCYCALGEREKVVDATAIHALMSRWKGGRLELVPGAEHEVVMETPPLRARFYDAAAALFDAAGRAAARP